MLFDVTSHDKYGELSFSGEGYAMAEKPTGTMDLKIAAITIANDATLLTRNVVDFQRIPNLRIEDWTA